MRFKRERSYNLDCCLNSELLMSAAPETLLQAGFRVRLDTIEQELDSGAYRPPAWQRLVADLRQAPADVRAALATDVSRVSRRLHLRRPRRTIGVVAGLLAESFVAITGGILLAAALARSSNVLAILAMILLVTTFQPLIKVAAGTAIGIEYDYVYLLGGFEPRFKMQFGSYLARPRWRRAMLHLAGMVGSVLAAAIVASLVGGRLHVAAIVSWMVFWIVAGINLGSLVVGLTGAARIGGIRVADASGGMLAVELRSAFSR
jgi:hypothetical protein